MENQTPYGCASTPRTLLAGPVFLVSLREKLRELLCHCPILSDLCGKQHKRGKFSPRPPFRPLYGASSLIAKLLPLQVRENLKPNVPSCFSLEHKI